ncbi:hypothetical protein JCM5353_002338 [Sporobolomyces roseus]
MSSKSNQQIIDESDAALNTSSDKDFDPKRTTLSDESGVNESGLDKFEGASVEVGRTGQTGGGDNMNIPVEQGGDARTNGSAAKEFDNVPAGETQQAKTNPGSINVSGKSQEALRTNDAPADGQPQLGEQTHFDELEHQSLSIVSTITCVGAVVLAILALIGRVTKSTGVLSSTFWLGLCWTTFSIAMTIWGAIVQAQDSAGLEQSITSSGLVVILCLGFIISPLAWLTYETYAYRRQLQTNPDSTEDVRGGPFLREGQAKTDALATQMQLQQTPSMAAELSKPFGRMRRGRGEQSYQRTYSESSESDGAEPQRKRRGSRRS